MNRTELVEAMVGKYNLTKKQAIESVEAFEVSISDALKQGDNVNISGFGSFSVVQRSARVGRNPRTGETLNIPAKKTVKFKPYKDLTEGIQ